MKLPKLLEKKEAEDSFEKILRVAAHQLDVVQQQIQVGEETYESEAPHHNIFKGWDGYIDSRSSSDFTDTRRIPQDHRWFSGSFQGPTADSPKQRKR